MITKATATNTRQKDASRLEACRDGLSLNKKISGQAWISYGAHIMKEGGRRDFVRRYVSRKQPKDQFPLRDLAVICKRRVKKHFTTMRK